MAGNAKNPETMFTIDTTGEQILDTDLQRRGGIIHNFAGSTVFLRAGALPVTTPGSIAAFVALAVGSSYNLEFGGSPNQDRIFAKCEAGTAEISVVPSFGG